jgi:hypothetical protein
VGVQTLSTFNNASLNAAVISSTGFDTASAGPVATVGLVTPNGTGNANIVLDENDAGTFTLLQSSAVTYSVSANGRTTISGLGQAPVFYLVGTNQGFVVGTDSAATFGSFEPQTGGPFANASLSGTYSYGTEGTDVGHRLTAVGALNFDGFTNDQATEDRSTPGGLNPNAPLPNNQYSFSSSSSPPGRSSLDTLGDSIAYIISPTKLVYLNPLATEPRLVFVEK